MSRILIVEDDEDIASGLAENLALEGHEVEIAASVAAGSARASGFAPDLVILDLMLPDGSGQEVLRGLRERGDEVPVLILSARGEEVDKVRGFRAGADDYVTKPFGLLELMLRVSALLRRSTRAAKASSSVARLGEIEIHRETRQVLRHGHEIVMAPKELDLLLALFDRHGAAMSRKEMLKEVWGYAEGIESRTVDWHIAELRRKLEQDPTNPELLLTVRKVGYRLVVP